MATLLGRPAADPVDPRAVALAEHAVDQAVVGGQVVLGQQADLERGLGDAGEPRLIRGPGLLVEVAPQAVRDEVVGEPLLRDLRVAVVQAGGFGLEFDEGAPGPGRSPHPVESALTRIKADLEVGHGSSPVVRWRL
ncbi:MAG: hypothetical protein WKF78_04080 [Candidatus Limnocylindrales bacterium]